MAQLIWEKFKERYCEKATTLVYFEAEIVYPEDWNPSQYPRILAHRCSHAQLCNNENRASCIWSGTNPMIDPFIE
jgi:hypothetical protein